MENKINEIVKNMRKVPVDTQTVDVTVQPNLKIVQNLYDAMNLKVTNKCVELGFELEEFIAYIWTIFTWRVDFVNGGKKVPVMSKYVRVPALINLTLAQVGPCYDADFGLIFKPILAKCEIKLGDEALMSKVSARLQSIADYGFSFAAGIPRNPEGDIGTMSFNSLDDAIRNYVPDKHPSKAMLATVAMLASLTSTVTYRIEYGTLQEFEFLVRELIYRD